MIRIIWCFIINQLSNLYTLKEKELNLTGFLKQILHKMMGFLEDLMRYLKYNYDYEKLKSYINIFELTE